MPDMPLNEQVFEPQNEGEETKPEDRQAITVYDRQAITVYDRQAITVYGGESGV